jgi:hypothetical protein
MVKKVFAAMATTTTDHLDGLPVPLASQRKTHNHKSGLKTAKWIAGRNSKFPDGDLRELGAAFGL